MSKSNDPELSEFVVKSCLPKGLEKLQELVYNVWWVWNENALALFRYIDEERYRKSGGNPIKLLETVPYERLEELVGDNNFIDRLNYVYSEFRHYIDRPKDSSRPSIAYFSMEYGITDTIKIYSGGLGVLAGDYLKEASDCNVDLTGVGFLYREGYFKQGLSIDGEQIAIYEPQDFNQIPIEKVLDKNGNQMVLQVQFPGYVVYCNIWKVNIGRVELYLMDTDNKNNSEFDRNITEQLYGGDWENRLKQEYLLGIGGIKLLNALGIKKDIYHCNEGHAALINAQRLADYVGNENLSFEEAIEVVRSSSLYTVHTPVPAGHDYFDESLCAKYLGSFPDKLGISWHDFMGLGRTNPDSNEKFCMSTFACNTSQEVNGVSWLHGKVSREMFSNIWKGYFPEELHVGYVTNGVHLPTWTSAKWYKLYSENFDKEWVNDFSDFKNWENIYKVPDEEIWNTHLSLKEDLVEYISNKYKDNWLKGQGDPTQVLSILEKINSKSLLIGFGRRFATYKRAHLLFTDLDRLSRIVNDPNFPVQFVFTGKAHPADGGGKGLIKRIVEISKMPEFQGKIFFLENYDMNLAKRLVSGVDIWLNTPTRPLEASGTSGQKAEMNGVLNFSVLDGWWIEGYKEKAGWAITDKRSYDNQEYQDKLDAATIYSMLENEIIPLYYAKNSKGYSPEWIMYMKNSIAKIAPEFTTKRMLEDYYAKFYNKLKQRNTFLVNNNYEETRRLIEWKENIVSFWDKITLAEKKIPEDLYKELRIDKKYNFEVVLCNVEDPKGIGVEVVTRFKSSKGEYNTVSDEMKIVSEDNGTVKYSIDMQFKRAGVFQLGIRMFPQNAALPHRQDFCYVRWL